MWPRIAGWFGLEAAPFSPKPEPLEPKLAGEEYLAAWNRLYATQHLTLRFGNVYGPRQEPHGEAGVVAIFMGLLHDGGEPTIFGDGGQTRDYVYVGDVVEAMLLASARDGGTFNVGTGVETSVIELYRAIEAAEFLMDYLKTSAPFWKQQEGTEDSKWIEARAHDDAAAARWTKS